MRSQKTLAFFSFFVLLPVCLSAQQVGAPTGVMGERDNSKENEVATLFESIRSAQKLGHLSRIQNRDILEEQICTVSLTGTPNSIPRDPDLFVIYKTSHPDLPSPELNRVATFDVLHPKSKREYPRYGVAVWRTKEPHTGDTAYWVGVHLYWSGRSWSSSIITSRTASMTERIGRSLLRHNVGQNRKEPQSPD
jgi:hypothetical protein